MKIGYANVLRNKEKVAQTHHKMLKEQQVRKAEHEFKRKQIGPTYQQFKWTEYIGKFNEQHENAELKKKTLDQQQNEKNNKFGK
jgi:hypothetical protein